MILELAGGGYRVRLDPAHGGAMLSADWMSPDGGYLPLLLPLDDAAPGFKAGCFPMVPFANRIADGRFSFGGVRYAVPVNHPDEGMAVHGFARDNPWSAISGTEAGATLEQHFAQASIPWRYAARQDIAVSADGIAVTLSVRNTGAAAMPFGIGLHPWFVKTPRARLSFRSDGTFALDRRRLPVEPLHAVPGFNPANPQALGDMPRFDGCFAGWSPRRATLVWPERKAAMTIAADGALRCLHVFVPDDRDVVCAEPVSHVPDAVNRPGLSAYGGMNVLQPGETLSGSMKLQAMSYPPARGRDDDPQDV